MTSINRNDGYLLLDHRAATPVDDSLVIQAGLPPGAGRGVFEGKTLYCPHCGTVVVKRPDRIRPREFCKKCDHYICDHCGAARAHADYVHRTFEDLALLVQSGKYTLAGSASSPVLIPIGAT
jgi:predicted RNA-binding Zn-ribbon protein involved in translation (DUF1610 family)